MKESKSMKSWLWCACVLAIAFAAKADAGKMRPRTEQKTTIGRTTGMTPEGMRYSPLAQINRENVASLKIAWTFHTGDISDGKGRRKRSGFGIHAAHGRLHVVPDHAFNRVIALDPETGAQRWAYDRKLL